MHSESDFLKNSVVIGAHPDDELLWFNSILRGVDEVIVVYTDFWAHPGLGDRRRRALADYPRANVSCLDIAESGVSGCADWSNPTVRDYGLALGIEAKRRALTHLARRSLRMVGAYRSDTAAEAAARTYKTNYARIRDALRARLRGDMNVFTHNPWGEYGHEEHVQLFRILGSLRTEIGFRLWMSNYCTERALPLAMRYFETAPRSYIRRPTDKAFAESVAKLYKEHNCWTWSDDWAWFDEECFLEAPQADTQPTPHRHLFPLNLFTIDGSRQKSKLPLALTMAAASAAVGAALADAN